MDDFMQKHGEIEDGEPGDEGEREPQVPLVESDDRCRRAGQRREQACGDRKMASGAPAMQGTKLLDRNLFRQSLPQLEGVIGIVVAHGLMRQQFNPALYSLWSR